MSKKERGPYRIGYDPGSSYEDKYWFVVGPEIGENYFMGKTNACFWRKNLNTAYLAGKRSRSKRRGE